MSRKKISACYFTEYNQHGRALRARKGSLIIYCKVKVCTCVN